jgi:hypothetical protein
MQQLTRPIALFADGGTGDELGAPVELLQKPLFVLWGELSQVRYLTDGKWKRRVSKLWRQLRF